MGKGIMLERFRQDALILDSLRYYQIAQDKEVEEYVPLLYPKNVLKVNEIFQMLYEHPSFKIVNEEKQFVGIIMGISFFEKELRTYCLLGKGYRKRGYMGEALTLFLDEIKRLSQYKKIQFIIKKDNVASQKVVEKLGISKREYDQGNWEIILNLKDEEDCG